MFNTENFADNLAEILKNRRYLGCEYRESHIRNGSVYGTDFYYQISERKFKIRFTDHSSLGIGGLSELIIETADSILKQHIEIVVCMYSTNKKAHEYVGRCYCFHKMFFGIREKSYWFSDSRLMNEANNILTETMAEAEELRRGL